MKHPNSVSIKPAAAHGRGLFGSWKSILVIPMPIASRRRTSSVGSEPWWTPDCGRNLYRNADARPEQQQFVQVLSEKCAFKGIELPHLADIQPHRAEVEAGWVHMLN